MMSATTESQQGPKSKKAKKADLGPPLSPASKAALKLQTKLASALAKREQKKKDAKKVRKEKKLARAAAIANGEEVSSCFRLKNSFFIYLF